MIGRMGMERGIVVRWTGVQMDRVSEGKRITGWGDKGQEGRRWREREKEVRDQCDRSPLGDTKISAVMEAETARAKEWSCRGQRT